MRIVTYNIRAGGGDRLGAIAAVLRAQRADAVALQEARPEPARSLALELGLEVVFGESNSIFDLHVAWLARPPLRGRNHRLPALSKTLLELELDGLRVFTTHLASRHEEHLFPRHAEMQALLGILAAARGPHLLVGDLNALAPGDVPGEPPPGVELRPTPRTILDPLHEAGYVDCYRSLHPHEPGWTYEARHPWLRIDYAFASPRLGARVHTCEVVTGPDAARASDHLPLLVELE